MVLEDLNLKNIPNSFGVYIFRDSKNKIIYIGKAKNLRKRVSQYFNKHDDRAHVEFLVKKITKVDFVITRDEQEALILENNLIKENQPKYNVRLKDDKNYYNIMFAMGHEFPAIKLTRQALDKNAIYFGPYVSSTSARVILDQVVNAFKLRTCSDREFANRKRACLKKDVGKCCAPCVGDVDVDDYVQMVNTAKLFLEGKYKEVLNVLNRKMSKASESMNYEEAGRLRDSIKNIKYGLKKQRIVDFKHRDADFWSLVWNDSVYVASIVMVRAGIIKVTKTFEFKELMSNPNDIMREVMLLYYGTKFVGSNIIFSNILPSDNKLLSKLIGMQISKPKKSWQGPMKLAFENSEFVLANKSNVLVALKNWLKLKRVPKTIEAFDVSHLGGKNCYGALVGFDDGFPNKSKYRLFKIKDESFDDYKMFHELISRRIKHGKFPDLILIDGGKGQLGIVKRIFNENNIKDVDIISISKAKDQKEDYIYKPEWKDGKRGDAGKKEYLLLEKIRDEVHRFGISAQRKSRSRKLKVKSNQKLLDL